MGDLVINGVLDAHSTTLRVDSYKIIDSANRAIVDLTSRTGKLSLGAGAQVDLRAGVGAQNNDGVARGTLDLNRVAWARLRARHDRRLRRNGARRGRVGRRRSADPGRQDGGGERLPPLRRRAAGRRSGRHRRPQKSRKAIWTASTARTRPHERRAGQPAVAAPGQAWARKLRPGVEVVSATPDGTPTVSGDIDLSNYRYGRAPTGSRPRGALWRPGVLVLRAGGNLNIYGSINDGWAAAGVAGRRRLALVRAVSAHGTSLSAATWWCRSAAIKLEAGTMFPTGSKRTTTCRSRPSRCPPAPCCPWR